MPDGCIADPTLQCIGTPVGLSCPAGDAPQRPGVVCSDPSPQADGTDGYCCATGFTGSTCAQDASVQGCQFPSIGFVCIGADMPDQANPAITCSAPVVDPNTGGALYCCL
jgi:hypothetical protein